MDSPLFIQILAVTTLLATGMGLALLGSVKLALATRLGIDEGRVGGLVSAFGLVLVPGVIAGGGLTDWLGKPPVIVGGAVGLAAGAVLLGRARVYRAAFAAVVVFAGSWGALIGVLNPLMLVAWKDRSPSAAANLGNVFFGIGAFLTPLAAAWLVRQFGLQRALLVLGVFFALPVVLALPVPPAVLEATQTAEATPGAPLTAQGQAEATVAAASPASTAALLRNSIVWLCALTLFFYGPLESTIAAWATTYLRGCGVRETQLAGWLSAFWLGFIASRLITALCLKPGYETRLLLAMAVLATAILTGIVLNRRRQTAMLLVVGAGLAFGPVFPTLIGLALANTDASLHGRVTAMVFTVGAGGWTTIPMLIGAVARRTNLQRALLIAVAAAVALCGVTLALMLVYQAR